MSTLTRILAASALLSFAVAPGSSAFAEMVKYKADLTAKSEVPATDSSGSGTADITVDTEAKKISWKVDVKDLSGDATAAHFHGPAKEGENAGPVVDISGNWKDGSADLTDEQRKQLDDGLMYLNVHTAKFPDGEIRGQVVKAQ